MALKTTVTRCFFLSKSKPPPFPLFSRLFPFLVFFDAVLRRESLQMPLPVRPPNKLQPLRRPTAQET
ncbi:UNVERIFIED_CONTAM: hypothetical protein Sradi_2341900 [Sesamum radiatum]|uniref:Uncharacterized protein n=1 Tax=Sesamum radiatum TaxID=300843 RepID=A0AAW2T8F3_SESRA